MFSLERTHRLRIASIILCLLSFAVGVYGWAAGGAEMLSHGFINEPLPCILMVACIGFAVIFLFLFLLIGAIEKDIKENLESVDPARR